MLAQDPELAAALAMLRAEIGPYLREVFAARENGPEAVWAAEGADALFDRFAAADPTPGKRYVGWLLGAYFREALSPGELPEAPAILAEFEGARALLPDGGREALDDFYEGLAGLRRQARRAETPHVVRPREVQARRETEILYEDPELTVAVPKTQRALSWWRIKAGLTAAALENFDDEPKFDACGHALLGAAAIIVVAIRGAFYFGDGKRESERRAEPDGRPWRRDMTQFAGLLAPFAERLRGSRALPAALALAGADIAPDAGAEDWFEALETYGASLNDVPEALRDADMCLLAVAKDPASLRFVPKALRTRALCRLAARRDGGALADVPEALRDPEICALALANAPLALRHFPDEAKDRATCLDVVRRSGWALQAVPEALRDREMCEIAVRDYGPAIKFVPAEIVDAALCRTAFYEAGLDRSAAFYFIPEVYLDRDICRDAVAANGFDLMRVPETLRDRQICLLALLGAPRSLYWIPPALRDRAACRLAVAWDGRALAHVPAELRDLALCRAAVQADVEALEFVPEDLRDAVVQAGHASA